MRWLAAARKTSGAERVRVLLEEVVLDLPRVVVAEPVGELDLVERLVEQLVLVVATPRLRELVLVEDPELHDRPPDLDAGARASGRTYPAGSPELAPERMRDRRRANHSVIRPTSDRLPVMAA